MWLGQPSWGVFHFAAIAEKVTEWKEKMAKGELPSTSEDKAGEIPSIYPREVYANDI